MIKKIFLTTGALASVISPALLVISCNDNDKSGEGKLNFYNVNEDIFIDKSKEITFNEEIAWGSAGSNLDLTKAKLEDKYKNQFVAIDKNGTAFVPQIKWIDEYSTTMNSKNFSHKEFTPGSYRLQLIATDSKGEKSTLNIKMVLDMRPKKSIYIIDFTHFTEGESGEEGYKSSLVRTTHVDANTSYMYVKKGTSEITKAQIEDLFDAYEVQLKDGTTDTYVSKTLAVTYSWEKTFNINEAGTYKLQGKATSSEGELKYDLYIYVI